MRPEDFRWSSYKAYIKQAKKSEWLYCEEVLSRCSEELSIKEYRKFVEDGIDTELVEVFSRARWPSVLGSQEWIEKLKTHCMAARVESEMSQVVICDICPQNVCVPPCMCMSQITT